MKSINEIYAAAEYEVRLKARIFFFTLAALIAALLLYEIMQIVLGTPQRGRYLPSSSSAAFSASPSISSCTATTRLPPSSPASPFSPWPS